MLCFWLILLLGEISGGRTLSFSGLPGTGEVRENSLDGAWVYTFNVTLSPPRTLEIGYPIIINSNPLTKAFRINPVSLLQYNVATSGNPILDYETMPHTFELQIFVRDSAGARALQILTVVVLDENEPPEFQDSLLTQTIVVYILENTPAGIIYQFRAVGSENSTSIRFFYSQTPETPFSVSSTGTIFSSKAFDYEKDPSWYLLNITVKYGQDLSTFWTVIINIININDESPYFNITERVFRIKEETITGIVVATITAVDPDGEFFNNILHYSITAPQGIPYFSINPGVSAIEQTLEYALSRILRMSTQKSHFIQWGLLPRTCSLYIENTGMPFHPKEGSWLMRADNGVIQVASRIDRDSAPLIQHANITLEILVEDSPSHGQSNSITIVITIEDINDHPPECQRYIFREQFEETIGTGTVIVDLKNVCWDHDAVAPNNLFNFTGLSGIGSHKFAQDPSGSGRIKLVGNVDLENKTGRAEEDYILNIVVEDIVQPFYRSNVSEEGCLHLIAYTGGFHTHPDNPDFLVYPGLKDFLTRDKQENPDYPVMSKIGTVTATDEDVPSTGISYSIVNGGGTLDYSDIFWIDPKEGTVQIVAPLDYEITQQYLLTVQASDNEGGTETVQVTVNVLEANDEKPVCSSSSHLLEVPVDLASGTNVNGLYITCVDRDSNPRSFRYFINSGNVNNHFTFSPSAGSGTSRLILVSPFDYERGLDRVWEYRLEVFITDDNLLSIANSSTALVQTGTVTLTIKVIPNPTTVVPTTPGITLLTRRENNYFVSAWYVPFIVSLGSLLLLGLLGYLTFLLAKYVRTHCQPKPKEDKKPLIKEPEKKKVKKETVWEITNINSVFDGEARDPVTGHLYEFNSKSGARRWKNTSEPPESEAKDPVAPVTATRTNPGQGNLSRKEAETIVRKQGREDNMASAPLEQKTEIPDQDHGRKLQVPKEESLVNGSAIPPRRSPIPSPKIYPKYQSQA